jgi:hypothetical protein
LLAVNEPNEDSWKVLVARSSVVHEKVVPDLQKTTNNKTKHKTKQKQKRISKTVVVSVTREHIVAESQEWQPGYKDCSHCG